MVCDIIDQIFYDDIKEDSNVLKLLVSVSNRHLQCTSPLTRSRFSNSSLHPNCHAKLIFSSKFEILFWNWREKAWDWYEGGAD